jgi:hypothetical protein
MKLKNHKYHYLDLFLCSGKGKETSTLLGPIESPNVVLVISKGFSTVGVSFSPEDGNRSSFLNVVFSSYLEFRTMDQINEASNSECYPQPLFVSVALM